LGKEKDTRVIKLDYKETNLIIINGMVGISLESICNLLVKSSKSYKNKYVKFVNNNYDIISDDATPFIKFYSIKNEINKRGFNFNLLLTSFSSRFKIDIWRAAYLDIIRDIKKNPPFYAIIFTNLIWFNEGKCFCPVDMKLFSEYDKKESSIKPRNIITLFGNLDNIKHVIEKGGATEHFIKFKIDLRDLVQIRELEIDIGRMIAQTAYGNVRGVHYVFSIENSIQNLCRLIFEPARLILYPTFPISRTRSYLEKQIEIDRFRESLYRRYILLDPLTIDADPFIVSLNEYYSQEISKSLNINKYHLNIFIPYLKEYININNLICSISGNVLTIPNNSKLTVEGFNLDLPEQIILDDKPININSKRWLLFDNFRKKIKSINCNKESYDNISPIEIQPNLFKICSQLKFIGNQYIENCDGMIAYRPYWDGNKSYAVFHNIKNSKTYQQLCGLRNYYIGIFSPLDDDIAYEKGSVIDNRQFSDTSDDAKFYTIEVCRNLHHLLGKLKKFQKNKLEIFIKHYKISNKNQHRDLLLITKSEYINSINEWYSTILDFHSITDSKKLQAEIYDKEIIEEDETNFQIIGEQMLLGLVNQIDIVIFCAIDVEKNSLLSKIEALNGYNKILYAQYNSCVYYLGRLGYFNVALTMIGKGNLNSTIYCDRAFDLWKPKLAIMCGIAYGLKPEKQKIGDVLVSELITNYEPQRIGEVKHSRGLRIPSSEKLFKAFSNIVNWQFKTDENRIVNIHKGQIISGEKLVDRKQYVEEFIESYPDAIGGEMEGAGFSLSAYSNKVDWIVAKSICDWGYDKSDNYQKLAADCATSLVFHVLSNSFFLEDFKD